MQQILYIDLAAACVRFEIAGGLVLAAISAPIVAVFDEATRRPAAHRLQLEARRAPDRLRGADGADRRLARPPPRRRGRPGRAGREAEELRDQPACAEVEPPTRPRPTVEELRRLSIAARRLRLARLARGADADGGGDRLCADAAATLARAHPEQRDAFLALIADETDRLAALVGEVLDSSRIEAGTFSYTFAELDLGGLSPRPSPRPSSRTTRIRISAEVPTDLPAVRGDPLRLRQVLTNLIDNAVKYSPEGAPVEVRAGRSTGTPTVEVVDHGSGIARSTTGS